MSVVTVREMARMKCGLVGHDWTLARWSAGTDGNDGTWLYLMRRRCYRCGKTDASVPRLRNDWRVVYEEDGIPCQMVWGRVIR